jgi:N6-L-threonylcarbamoyladenine synthase
MNILGIETSCDETAAAVVFKGKTVLSNIVSSSLKEHAPYGGIIPEIASRRQLEFINRICARSLSKAGLGLKKIDTIAVTSKPGLIGSLLVGISFARALSFALHKPLVYVDHIQAHAYANFLDLPSPQERRGHRRSQPRLPAVALIVSGGHTNLYFIETFDKFLLLGQTLDDAAGEAFDKVAKILGLGYPGGPIIDRLAKKATRTYPHFKSAALPGTHDFSFSGVKTAVLYYYQKHKNESTFSANQIAHSFQDSVVSILVQKSISACRAHRCHSLFMGGGVAANSALRESALREGYKNGINVHFPPLSLCTDNAAMIAGLGFHLIKKRRMTPC